MTRAPLYTPQMLAAAMRLADFPHDPVADAPGARTVSDTARPCGSRIAVAAVLDDDGAVSRIGASVSACAVGQAAAAAALMAAAGRDAKALAELRDAVSLWLDDGDAPMPDCPGLDLLAPARAVSGRHGAIRLPFAAIARAATASPGD